MERDLKNLERDLRKFGSVTVCLRKYTIDGEGLRFAMQHRLHRAVRIKWSIDNEWAELVVEDWKPRVRKAVAGGS